MPPAVWTVLVTDGCRSFVELRDDGLIYIRPDLTLAEAHAAIQQLAQALYLTRKEPNASH